jgi:hypothetical protein
LFVLFLEVFYSVKARLTVFESRVLRKIFESTREEVTEDWRTMAGLQKLRSDYEQPLCHPGDIFSSRTYIHTNNGVRGYQKLAGISAGYRQLLKATGLAI